jgi:hypothetical protein
MSRYYYNNGCSFSYGATLNDPHPAAWPLQVGQQFDHSVNEAVPAGSNHRSVRRSIEFLSQVDDPSDWFATLQLTSPDRSEYVEGVSGAWIGICNGVSTRDDRAWQNADIDFDNEQALSKLVIPAHTLSKSTIANQIDTLFLIHSYVSFCENLGIQYLITGMSARCMPREFAKLAKSSDDVVMPGDLSVLAGLVDTLDHKQIVRAVSDIVRDNVIDPVTDLHPDTVGHTMFARYILSKVKME